MEMKMKKREIKKLSLSRETLHRLEAAGLRAAGAGTNQQSICVCQTNQETICICDTDLCISLGYTGCVYCGTDS
jgi:hypothetical protein